MHHGDDPHAVRLRQINDRIGELAGQCTAGRRTKPEEAVGLVTHDGNHPFNFVVKLPAQLRINVRVITDGLGEFGIRFGMDGMSHRPAILRIRARDSSKGMPFTSPD